MYKVHLIPPIAMKPDSLKNHISVDCVIFGYNEQDNKLEVLLIEQKELPGNSAHPDVAHYALPGSLVNENESLDDAAVRVLAELTPAAGLHLHQFHSFGDPMRTKEEKDTGWLEFCHLDADARVITVSYYTLVRKDVIQAEPGSFAGNMVWRNTRRVPPLAFDHNQVVKKAIEDIRERIYQNDIAYQLLPKKFTLRQLQSLYEAVLNTGFDKRNFVKRIKKDEELIALDEKQTGVVHKPAHLYSFKVKRKRS